MPRRKPTLEIANRMIGEDYKPLIVAEIGINHNGNLNVAFEMVDAAKRAGVEVIKHQTHIIHDEMSAEAKKVIPGNSDKSIYEIMSECALSEEKELQLKNYIESLGMIFISTPFSRKAVDRLVKFDVPAFKIGSGECNNLPLLEYISRFKKPIILSTGMNGIKEIKAATEIFRKNKIKYALLHCTNLYPTPYKFIRLNCITELKEHFPNAVVGLSDHSLSNLPCLGAVALGASILERHFTDHYNRQGPDIEVSMDEKACKELIEGSQILYECRNGNKAPLPEEKVTIDFAFASVVSIQEIKKGNILSQENLWVKRPGTGEFKATSYSALTNGTYVAAEDIPNDTMLKKSMIKKSR